MTARYPPRLKCTIIVGGMGAFVGEPSLTYSENTMLMYFVKFELQQYRNSSFIYTADSI